MSNIKDGLKILRQQTFLFSLFMVRGPLESCIFIYLLLELSSHMTLSFCFFHKARCSNNVIYTHTCMYDVLIPSNCL
ncbi:hypothetical protein KFK09_020450 [Dendrobium nobile]|uniref:Uncharacterized protein n=1 Tax=Dendrobium nobile TaxID=94219 RepID=A0A8T3ALW6_DENNO|nr:hypothetical protein KFK09_020450 [Dendrobium nobile]